jgi:hypothetical protein
VNKLLKNHFREGKMKSRNKIKLLPIIYKCFILMIIGIGALKLFNGNRAMKRTDNLKNKIQHDAIDNPPYDNYSGRRVEHIAEIRVIEGAVSISNKQTGTAYSGLFQFSVN